MPERHESARFGEEEEQQPVDDRERLLEDVGQRPTALLREQRPQYMRRGLEHPAAERPADACGVSFSLGQQRAEGVAIASEPCRHEQRCESRRGSRVVGRFLEVHLGVAS